MRNMSKTLTSSEMHNLSKCIAHLLNIWVIWFVSCDLEVCLRVEMGEPVVHQEKFLCPQGKFMSPVCWILHSRGIRLMTWWRGGLSNLKGGENLKGGSGSNDVDTCENVLNLVRE